MHTGLLSREEILTVLAIYDGVIEDLKRKKIKIICNTLLVDSLKE